MIVLLTNILLGLADKKNVQYWSIYIISVSYTHLTLPTIYSV